MASKPWRDVNAIYQIYPRSFKDSNGDGVGDLRGVIKRLDYLKGTRTSLQVDTIWFSPIFPSPMADMGYDVSNYCDIDPLFGTLDDFKELLEKAHARDLNVMLDFVPNHTSIQHPWFMQSRQSRHNDKSDYYLWRDAKPDGTPPNNWLSIFGGSAWQWDETREQYYLHTFLREQPDLNWDNPAVRKEMRDVIRFWMELGVDGIRADAVRWLSKDPGLGDDPIDPNWRASAVSNEFDSLLHTHSRFGKNLFPYLRELTDVIADYDNRIIIFEDYPDQTTSTEEQYLGFYNVNPGIGMPFNFQGISTDFSAEGFRNFITEFQGMLNPDTQRPVYCFSNHDQQRIATRMGGGEQARLIALLQLTLPGLPTIYYGDEIGMADGTIPPEAIRDLSARQMGKNTASRDPERTPMRWNEERYADFSTVEPWLPVGDGVAQCNVATELQEPDSFLALYKRLLALRSRYGILRNGTYEAFSEQDDDIFMFSRWLGHQHVFVALNFGATERQAKLPHSGRVLCCTHPVDYPDIADDGIVSLRPYEGVLVECQEHPLQEDAASEAF